MAPDTIRVIFLPKGSELSSPAIGFFEVIVWLVAVGQVTNTMTNAVCCSAHGGRFATGTVAGIAIEEKIPLGVITVRTNTMEDPRELKCSSSVRITTGLPVLTGRGFRQGEIGIHIKRQDLSHMIAIRKLCPNAFSSIEGGTSVAERVFPERERHGMFSRIDPFCSA
jgi:uncharacterized protein YebE (UPF0316 family)